MQDDPSERLPTSPAGGHAYPGWPQFDDEMIEAAARVLHSGRVNYWTGDEGRQFEDEFAVSVDCRHAIALANGTAALELALEALEISPGNEVIVPSRTFIASASAVVRCGARPVFADVDRTSQNITAESILERITPRTKAIIVVHLAGWPCEMDAILELAGARHLAVVEDCAQAHGARYNGKPVGSLGDLGTFSFCQDKIMTTAGEGGMLVTNRPELWRQAWSLKDHGKSYDAVYNQSHATGFRWLHEQIGTNLRLTEVQAAIGRAALRRVPAWIEARRRNAEVLNQALSSITAIRTTIPPAHVFHAYYKYYAFVRPKQLSPGWTRDRIIDEINRAGVPCYSGSCSEVYLEKAFSPADRPAERLPIAHELGETSLMLLVHPTLTEADMQTAAAVVKAVLQQATENKS